MKSLNKLYEDNVDHELAKLAKKYNLEPNQLIHFYEFLKGREISDKLIKEYTDIQMKNINFLIKNKDNIRKDMESYM